MSLRKTLTALNRPSSPPDSSISAVKTESLETSGPSSSKITFRPRKIRKVSPATVTASPLSSKSTVDAALRHLRISDELLGAVISAHSTTPPVFESTSTPFLSLARSILYQQLATKAAKCIYDRFVSLFRGGEPAVLPESVTSISAVDLREIGVSGRKASYLHDLAGKYEAGVLSDEMILGMSDEELVERLTSVKGIGVWTVHMFMMFSLHRPDVLPVGDLGVRKGVRDLYGLKNLPGPLQMEQLCEKWRPYRSVGSWYMWRLIESNKTSKTKLSK
ncbi:DNA glycosylase superfamily protein [Raphanus sativus]|uniref:DNA-3-methyladenine glycosylase 1 n=1 Tax=Raphanus sativus TaxID=3726 RepID=A0A6J0JDL8_RAPSA|nr:DNA-3-methyladenine glycosylase 1 [Raphanus sativus]KAJ4890207.1 DNA glycosylase superfamily protein [Raphanus sativus]